MANIFNAVDMTSGAAVKQIHAGVNSKVVTWETSSTRSGSVEILITPLPGGARVQSGMLRWSGNPGGTAAALISVSDSLGNAYYLSTAYAASIYFNGPGLGERLTGSANLIVRVTDTSSAPAVTGSVALTLSLQYIAEDDAD